MDSNKAFRDYATRVSFNVTLTRNQIYTLMQVVEGRVFRDTDLRESWGLSRDWFVPGVKWLESHGFVKYTDPATMKPAGKDYPWRLTPAGEAVVVLLRIAGLIPARAENDDTKTEKKRRAR